VVGLFRELNEKSGITIILVTHNQQIARDAKRTVVMRDGAIVCDTTDFRLAAQALREDLDENLQEAGRAQPLSG
jgi:putative ABC transport system ATP-binding protein